MDTRRLILFLIFSFSLVMLWDAWQRFNHPPQPAVAAAPSVTPPTGAAALPVPAAAGVAALPGAAPAATPVAAAPATELIRIKTDLYTAEVSSIGGDLVRLELNNYKSATDAKNKFVLFESSHKYAAQSGLIGEGLPNHRTPFRVVAGPRDLGSADRVVLRLEADGPAGSKIAKTFTFRRGDYLIDVGYEGEGLKPGTHAYFQFQRDDKAPEGESSMISTFTGPAVFTEQEKYQKVDFGDIAKDKAKFTAKADNGWVAMIQHYFVASWLPTAKTPREFFMRKLDGGTYAAGVIVPLAVDAAGKATLSMPMYAGPQEQAKLEKIATGLELVVDYGWLHLIAAPIFWLLGFIYKFVGNWGWAIVVLTVLIKGVFFPLSAASYKSMARMRQVTPRLMALKERYGDDRQKLNQEMMELYRKEKINPLGGCLPILVQIPVFISLYWVLLGAVEMRGAEWILWIKDLAAEDPYYILPVIMVASMLIQTKLNPTPPDPIQAKVMMMMPFIFGAMFFFFPSGLVLYWVVNNVLSIAQQWQITRMIEGGKAA
jgi:YidC/Oxa1 family membrane protein insertase